MGLSQGPLTVLGIRHGEVHNPKGVIYAGLDGYGLSDTGRSQAKAVAEALRGAPVTSIYASPLDRAMQTAGFIAEVTGGEIVPDDRLYEWRHWQQWAGMTWEELRDNGREAWDAYMNDPGSVTSGESLEELADRFGSWLEDVKRDHGNQKEKGIVIGVTHLEGLRATLLRALGRPAKDLFTIDIGLSGVVRLFPDPTPLPIPLDGLADVLES
jgi:probable phosphoglycerate mutase